MFTIGKDLKQQGLDKSAWYEATVIDNNDPLHRCRVRARIVEIFEGIADQHLPWAIPLDLSHPDGASSTSGRAFVPKVGSKVLLQFQQGSAEFPVYRGYLVDDQTKLSDMDLHYPNRIVTRLKNNSVVVVDTQTNEVFLRLVGQVHLFIEGNLDLTVNGNVTERIKGNKSTYIDGQQTVQVAGNNNLFVNGSDSYQVQGNHVRNASFIDDNISGPTAGPGKPTMPPWPGISGDHP